ncbi:MAG: S-layer homology domain-containing protein [Clostridiales bacterium]|nr:S-layer homology domain-containing protein [Clostridiales bacterium]
MKFSILKGAVCAMSLALALIPAGIVSADEEKDIKFDSPIAVDFESDPYWQFTYDSSKDSEGKFIEFFSTGSTDTVVYLYKDDPMSASIANDDNSGDENNCKLTKYLEPGIYYFLVRPHYVDDIDPANDTIVELKNITDKTVVAKINSTNFPDAVFRDFVDSKYDVRNDGVLTKDEINAVTQIDVSSKNISSLKGIEYFSELFSLTANNTKLKTLDLSKNTKIQIIGCSFNYDLKSINLNNCVSLNSFRCNDCSLTSLKVDQCNMLREIDCKNNSIKDLDLSGLKYLTDVYCQGCQIETLNVRGCKALVNLDCTGNKITSLDLSTAASLVSAKASGNQIGTFKISKSIRELDLTDNAPLEKLDLTGCTRLRELLCSGTKITGLDISDSPRLMLAYNKGPVNAEETDYSTVIAGEGARLLINPGTKITFQNDPDEQIVKIDETNFPDFNFRYIKVNSFDNDGDGYLSRSEIRTITTLDIDYRYYASLKGIEYFTELEELSCANNGLTELDLSKNTKLVKLDCSNNSLEKLDVSKNKMLKELECGNNPIKDLDLRNNADLELLEVSEAKLTKLDLSKNTKLEALLCYSNQLTALDISNNRDLECVACFGNKISKLDIINNPTLLSLYKNSKGEEMQYEKIKIITYADYKNILYMAVDVNTVIVAAKPTATPTPTVKPTVAPTKAAAVSLTLNKKTANVTCGKNITLKATLTGASSKITWKSSNSKIATVDASGKIKAKMAGKVTITATAAGKSAKCTVTVLYKDVTNSKDFWYAPTNYLTAKGVVKGYDNQTKFKPANKCTRAQMVTFIWRLQGSPKPKTSKCKFSDVKKTDYFYKACIWGNENHIVEGYKNGTFGPQIVCARRHAVTFLWRLANKPKPTSTKNKFKDVKKSDYFYQATLWASEKKILAGYEDGTFRPDGDCLRRQMVTFLYKYDKFVNGKG